MNNTKKKISLVDAIRSITSSAMTMLPAIIPLLSVLVLNSCNDDSMISPNQLVQGITVSSEDFVYEQTRSAYSVDESGFHFTWAAGDTIGIYPVGGDQVSFPISSGDGSATAQFDGGAWSLRSSYSYAAYYPFSGGNYHVKETSLPVSYLDQSQNGNGSLTHLGKYDYQASVATRPSSDGYVNIQMKHLGSFVRFQLTMPEADSYSVLEITSDRTPFVTAGAFNLTSATPAIIAKGTSQTMRIGLSSTSTESKNQVLTIYCMMAPVDLSGSNLSLKIYGSSNRTYSATVEGKTMLAGKAYGYAATITSGTNVNGEDVAWDESGNVIPVVTHEYVDLGLPSGTLWATTNVGATRPEEYGDYFAWGETEPKLDYSRATYKYCKGSYNTITKYCIYSNNGYNGFTDNKTVLDPEDDAAHVNWGGSWRMPTHAEQSELLNTSNCTWTWTTLNGVNGYKVQSKKSGYTDKWIFLPAAGFRDNSGPNDEGSYGYYWFSSLQTDYPDAAYSLYFYSYRADWSGSYFRSSGLSVRPVYSDDPNCGITGISLNKSTTSISVGSNEKLIATVSKKSGAVNNQVEWYSSNPSVATIDYSGKVTAVSVGTATITAKTVFGGFAASCTVTVTSPTPTYEYVDLGLSVKWATFNVGATKPEEYGDYFAWGATEPLYEAGHAQDKTQNHWKDGRSAGYVWGNTPFQTANTTSYSFTKWTKYLGSTTSSYKDSSATDANALKTVLDLEDDAAHVNWGASWRIPTCAEQDELRNNCTWTWYDEGNSEFNGVAGYKVQSKKAGYTDKWIFLPAAGYRYDSYLSGVGSYGLYWSSSLYSDYPGRAYYLYFYSGFVGWDGSYRSGGRSVRPVCP